MANRRKARVLLTTRRFRISIDARDWKWLEVADGHDRLGVRRWRDPDHAATTPLLHQLLSDIVDALLRRAKRRKARHG